MRTVCTRQVGMGPGDKSNATNLFVATTLTQDSPSDSGVWDRVYTTSEIVKVTKLIPRPSWKDWEWVWSP